MRTLILLASLLVMAMPLAAAPDSSTSAEIQRAATSFLNRFASEQEANGFTVEFTIGHLDPRLSLAPCLDAIDADFSGDPWQSSQPTLLMSCHGNRPWRMFLPVALTIKGNVFTASRPIGRGERIAANMLTSNHGVMNSSRRPPITRLEDLIGKEMTRSVNRGTILTSDLIVEPDAVQRGDHVMIVARSGGYSVRTRGKALANGQPGEQVLVENLSSSRRVRARVISPGVVEIPM